MPMRDGTGPLGRGQMTGRGMGPCGGGMRRGFGRGRGRGLGFRRGGFRCPYPSMYQPTKEEESKFLQDEIKFLQDEIEYMKKRLEELKGEK